MSEQAIADDLRLHLDRMPMSGTQIGAVAVLGALAALDGYDVLAVTFAAPGITAEWGIDRAALGIVFSMGLLGMALGSLLIAPFADRFGRKPLVLVTLWLMAGGMLASAFSQNVTELSIYRVVTGLGIGGMISVVVPMAAEFANARRRTLAVGIGALGFPIGGVIGGSIAAALLQWFDWRAVFFLGAGAALVMTPVVMRWAPESIAYLLTRKSEKALAHLNRVLARIGQPSIAKMPAASEGPVAKRAASIFSTASIARTLLVTALNFFFVINVYFMLSWMPQMTADAGFSPSAAASVSVIANLTGVIGGLLLGWAAPHLGLKPLAIVAFIGLGAATVVFGFTPSDIGQLRGAGALVGFFMIPGMVGIYTIIARSFPAETRATGAGFVVGMGRASSALAPIIAGLLFANGFGRDAVSIVMGACAIVAAIVLIFLRLSKDEAEQSA